MPVRRLLAALLLAHAPALAGAQATPTIDPADPVYTHVDRLVAAGVVDRALVGQRPLSRRELARIAREAEGNLPRLAPDGRRALLAERWIALVRRAAGVDGGSGAPVTLRQQLRAEAMLLGSPPRALRHDTLGGIDADIVPLAGERQGRRLVQGANLALETAHHLTLGRHLALVTEPRLLLARDQRTGETQATLTAPRLHATLGAGNLLLTLGREYAVWGQGMTGGLAGSLASRGLAMAKLASDAPFELPWVLRLLGPMRASIYLADLGRNQNYPRAQLVGYKLSALPHRRVELGVTVLDQMGGRGGPPAHLGERLIDVVPLLDVIFIPDRDLEISNKFAGAELRVRIPEARGLELFVESLLDDFDARRLKRALVDDNGVQVGARLARLSDDGALRLDAEFRRTGLRYYMHRQFTSGLASDRSLIGDPLGPRAHGGYARLTRDVGDGGWLALDAAYEWRSNDLWVGFQLDDNETGFGFRRVESRPKEIRRRAVLTWALPLAAGAARLEARAGYERVTDHDFRGGAGRHDLLAALALRRSF